MEAYSSGQLHSKLVVKPAVLTVGIDEVVGRPEAIPNLEHPAAKGDIERCSILVGRPFGRAGGRLVNRPLAQKLLTESRVSVAVGL
jgi:hypothetical protein